MAEPKQILIVEDNEANQLFLSQILEDNGYAYRVAPDGKQAMAALKESRPDLVLLDVMMPRKSGIQVYEEMKKHPELAEIPVIVVTGAAQVTGIDLKSGAERPKESYGDDAARRFGTALREKLAQLKPDALIEKPIDPPLLVEKIKTLLR